MRFALLGLKADLRDAVDAVRGRYAAAPIVIHGTSGGTGVVVRFLGEEGAAAFERGIAAAVTLSPGYNARNAFSRVRQPFSGLLLWRLKRFFVERNAGALGARDADATRAALAARFLSF